MVWTGSEYGLACARANGNGGFIRFDEDGNKKAIGGLTGVVAGDQDGYFYIRNAVYGTYLTDNGDGNLSLTKYDASAPNTQKWILRDFDDDAYFQVINKSSGRFITGRLSGGGLGQTLGLLSSGGDMASLYQWWLYPYTDTGMYLLRIQYDIDYRVYATGEEIVKLKTSTRDQKKWELLYAGN